MSETIKIGFKYCDSNMNNINQIASEIYKAYKESEKDELIIVNIGTDKVIFDSLACLTGTLTHNKINMPIYGTLNTPVHALNLKERLEEIKINHSNAFVLAIDACLGDKESVGRIELRNKPITPGSGVGKDLPKVGDYSLIGIVDDRDNDYFIMKKEVRLDTIYNMAQVLSDILINTDKYINKKAFHINFFNSINIIKQLIHKKLNNKKIINNTESIYNI